MTQPIPGDDLRSKLEEQAKQYEAVTEALVVGAFASSVTAATNAFLAAFIAGHAAGWAGNITLEAVRQLAVRLFDIPTHMSSPLRRRAAEGIRLGAVHGRWTLAGGGRPPRSKIGTVKLTDSALIDAIDTIDPKAQQRLTEARKLAKTSKLSTLADATTVTNSAQSAVTMSKRQTAWAAARSLNAGVVLVAQQEKCRIIWVPERDACLRCLAYAGLTVTPPDLFPIGLTFGDTGSDWEDLPYPPLHPYCRCRAETYDGPDWEEEKGSALNVATALRREAERSVARGLSDYHREPELLRAADRLVKATSMLPPTVLQRAARDVRRKKFTARPTGL